MQCSPTSPAPGLVTESLLTRLRADDDQVKAWSYLPTAIPSPATHDGRPSLLQHMLFGVKDVIDVAGMPTRFGATAEHERSPYADAWCVSALRKAGATPIGKTVTAEFAFRSPGPTRNPNALTHTPGGSSSGSAAAVAAGMVPFALSTQTGGSIIRPAAYCGVVGFKPTYQLLPRNGLFLTCESLDVIGWHSANLAVSEAIADTLLPLNRRPLDKNIDELRYAVVDWNPDDKADDDARGELARVTALLDAAGALQSLSSIKHETIDSLMRAHAAIMHYEFARSLYPVFAVKPNGISQHVKNAIEVGLSIARDEYLRYRKLQRDMREQWDSFLEGTDIVITYSAPGAAPEGLSFTGSSAFCKPWSVLGWPALHLPTAENNLKLPVGVQLIGPPRSDHILMQWAQKIQTEIEK